MAIASRKTGKYPVTWQDIRCGEKFVVHSREWFDNNCIEDGDGDYVMDVTERGGSKCTEFFTNDMLHFLGKTVTVKEICDYILVYEEDIHTCHKWYPEMFECVVNSI